MPPANVGGAQVDTDRQAVLMRGGEEAGFGDLQQGHERDQLSTPPGSGAGAV